MLLVGQHQIFGSAPTDLVTTVTVGSDQGGLEPVTWKGFDAKGDRGALWLFVRRVQVFRGFEQGRLQIATRVGNSGDSSEPHLHFRAYRIDASGRARAVPVTFSDAWHDAKGTQPVEGVPLAGAEYTFRAAR